MGIFRYIWQGFGWEIGAQAAREGIDAVKTARETELRLARARPVSLTPWAVDERRQRKAERRQRVAAKKRRAELERQLRELKRKARES